MNKFWKKLTVSVLATAFAFSSFSLVSCGKEKAKYNPDNFLTESEAESQYGNKYRIVKDSITMRIFVPKHATHAHYKDMLMFKKLSEMTNINFDFIEADTDAVTTLRTTTWANKDDLPDLFLYGNPVCDQIMYASYNALHALDDDNLTVSGVKVGNLIENYMPNYKALLDNNFNMDEAVAGNAKTLATMPDGHMYSVVCNDDIPHNLTYKMYINTQWIDNINEENPSLNLTKDPQTVEEYIEILRAFKEYDANRNGDNNDEIPVSATDLQYLKNFIMSAYGYVTDTLETAADGNGFTYVPSTEAYREYLKTMNLMYTEGLIDQSTFEMTSDGQLTAKGRAGVVGSFAAAGAYLVVGKDKEAQYDSIGPLLSSYYRGEKLQWSLPMLEATGCMIPSSTQCVREIARLLDILYTEFGTQLQTYGIEGETFSWDNAEKTSWTYNLPSDYDGRDEEYRATICPQPFLGAHLYLSNDFMSKDSNPIVQKIISQAERYKNYLKSYSIEYVKLAPQQYNQAVNITANLNTYIKNAAYSFITGKKDAKSDTDWNKFISDLNGYNYTTLVNMYNDAD